MRLLSFLLVLCGVLPAALGAHSLLRDVSYELWDSRLSRRSFDAFHSAGPAREPSAVLTHASSFLLQFRSDEYETPYVLSLRPANDLLPGPVRYDNGQVSLLERHHFRAFQGRVLSPRTTGSARIDWLEAEERGGGPEDDTWARIVAVDAGGTTVFQGSFQVDGEIFSVHQARHWEKSGDAHYFPAHGDTSAPGGVLAHSGTDSARGNATPPPRRLRRDETHSRPLPHAETHSTARSSRLPHPPTLSSRPAPAGDAPAMVLVRERDLSDLNTCGHDQLAFNSAQLAQREALAALSRPSGLFGRSDISSGSGGNASSNYINSIGSTKGCPKARMAVFVGVAADCTYTSHYGGEEEARTQLLTQFNTVSGLYVRTFNVSLGVVEINVQTDCGTPSWNVACDSMDIDARLSAFSQWRGKKTDRAGLWHLLTSCNTGSEVGVAWLGQLCRVTSGSSGEGNSSQIISGTAVTSITKASWQVIAHEIGHNFGAIHDCAEGCSTSGSCCPLSKSECDADADYLMTPVSHKNTTAFSPCSIGNICTALSTSLNTTCVREADDKTNPTAISLQSCGNGIVDEGEDCDSSSDCCDSSTCKFKSGAVCDPSNSLCCTSSCQVASAGTVCRESVDAQCDITETCSGTSAACPSDSHQKDGSSCGSGLSCASGVCTSRNQQCVAASADGGYTSSSGQSVNLTQACPTSASKDCSIACLDPTTASSCVVFDQTFRDGTSCGYGGRCAGGECKSGSALDTAKSWYTQNLAISIPVTVVVGLIVLTAIYFLTRCLLGGCRRRNADRPVKSYADYYPSPPNYEQNESRTNPFSNRYAAQTAPAYPPNANYAPPYQPTHVTPSYPPYAYTHNTNPFYSNANH